MTIGGALSDLNNLLNADNIPVYYKEYDAKAFSDPVEEPNIYCTRDDGSVNRQQPFREFYSQHFGACLWDRQHEWDTCDAWEKDRNGPLREEQT